MKTIIYLALVLLISSCQRTTENTDVLIESLPSDLAAYQRTIVGQLSGEYELANRTHIRSRWTTEERLQSRNYLTQLIQTLDIEPQQQAYTSANLNPAIDLLLWPYRGTNVYDILPATTPEAEYLILGGHYDTGKRNAPGAVDNATGIALIYGVARELAKVEERNKHIVLVFFDQEEEELIGSKAFLALIKDQKWDIHSVHCFDMVGWDGDGDDAMEMYSASTSLRRHYKEVAEQRGKPLFEIVIEPEGYDANSTDFDAFVPDAYNAIGLGECFYHRDYSPYKDSPDDTFDTVNFPYLLSCTEFVGDAIKKLVTP